MFKKLTGKTLSLILAVMMLVSLVPLSAAAATVKVSESFGGFSAEQLETTYTSTSAFTSGNATAPWARNGVASIVAQPKKDADGTEYLHIEPTTVDTTVSLNGAIKISDPNLNIGTAEGQNNTFTFKTRLRKNYTTDNLFFVLLKEDGSVYTNWTVRLWLSSGRIDYFKGSYVNAGLGNMAVNEWYDLTMTWDLKNNSLVLGANGKNIADKTVTITDATAISTTETAPITGVMVGWQNDYTADNPDWGFDIASMSLSNIGSTTQISKDELVVENTNLDEHAAAMGNTAWTSGTWDIEKWMFNTGYSSNRVDVVETGDSHGYAMKLTGEATNPFRLRNTPTAAITSGKVVLEAATKDAGDGNSQLRLRVWDSAGADKYILYGNDTTGSTMQFCGETAADKLISELVSTDWVRTRVILDLDSDTAEVSYWSESNPTDIVTYTSTGSANVTALTDIKQVRFEPLGRTAETVMYIDNVSVSSGSVTLFAEDVAPANNATKVSVGVKPSISFNAPVKVAEIFTLTDEDGNTVAGTAGLTADGRGLAFYPAEELKPATTYTLTANGTVTDVFGDTAAVNETITFTTDDVITVNDVVFGGAISEGALVAGDLTATVDITTCDGAARDILVLMGLYDSETKELKDFDVKYLNTADYDETLTVTVPATGSYYPVVYVWNNYSSLKPYVAPITLD